jgi:hypothetical protein
VLRASWLRISLRLGQIGAGCGRPKLPRLARLQSPPCLPSAGPTPGRSSLDAHAAEGMDHVPPASCESSIWCFARVLGGEMIHPPGLPAASEDGRYLGAVKPPVRWEGGPPFCSLYQRGSLSYAFDSCADLPRPRPICRVNNAGLSLMDARFRCSALGMQARP